MDLFCNGIKEPINIDVCPSFSWKVKSEKHLQKAYHLIVKYEENIVWDSKRVESNASVFVAYEGLPLLSNTKYTYIVTIWDNNEQEQTESSFFETSLLSQSDWHGKWIGMGNHYRSDWAFNMRCEEKLDLPIKTAKAYVCGLGYYEFRINREKVGDHMLDTAQTEYEVKVLYSTYDIKEMLVQGANCFGLILGDGWYHQSQLMAGGGIYGEPCALLQIYIEYENGITQEIVTDLNWKTNYSPIVRNNVYTGETYDARIEQKDWDKPGFDDSSWYPVYEETSKKGTLRSQLLPPIRVVKELKPINLTSPQRGVFVFDMGENFAGIVRLDIWGCPGNEVVMRFAESLDETGMIDITSSGVFHIRGIQTIRYIFGERGNISYTPRFTYHGFRYVELSGAGGPVNINSVTGLKMNTDLMQTGFFMCDMPVLNTMHNLLYNSFTSNCYGIPTDCPAREKCGWTGDANIIADTSMVIWDTYHFWNKYLQDTKDSYKRYGIWQNVMPGKRGCRDTVPAWGCAMINIPWYSYLNYGDVSILNENIDQMLAWHEHMLNNTTNLIYNEHVYQLADWCAPYKYKSSDHYTQISTAFFYMSTVIINDVLIILGRRDDKFKDLAHKIKDKFIKTFYDFENHTYGTQTLNSFCIDIGLFSDGEEIFMAKWIAEDMKAHDNHVTCGHIGLRYIFKVLTRYGYNDIIKVFIEKEDYPSFGQQIKHGATTLYERWETDSDQSYNHHFKGAYGIWLYNEVLGIKNTSVAYKTFTIKPETISIIKSAKGSIDTVYGRISVDYNIGEYFRVEIPSNTIATVYVPDINGTYTKHELLSGKYEL